MSTQQKNYWEARHKNVPGIRAVGHCSRTEAANQVQYKKAAEMFRRFVTEDFPDPVQRGSVLDVGYGQGHYAKLCKELGFQSYLGLDFAAPSLPDLGPEYKTTQVDFGTPQDFGQKFDLIICIDVLYHITDRSEFETAVQNLSKHAKHRIYITGLFEELKGYSHCHHRALDDFLGLGKVLEIQGWRDNKIARFAVQE